MKEEKEKKTRTSRDVADWEIEILMIQKKCMMEGWIMRSAMNAVGKMKRMKEDETMGLDGFEFLFHFLFLFQPQQHKPSNNTTIFFLLRTKKNHIWTSWALKAWVGRRQNKKNKKNKEKVKEKGWLSSFFFFFFVVSCAPFCENPRPRRSNSF